MPVYEYRCNECGKRFAKLVGVVAGSSFGEPACPACGGEEVVRLISRFSRPRSEDERLDAIEDAALAGGDDPAAMSRLLREMGREMGEDGEDGIEEYLEESERELYDGAANESDAEFC